MPEKHNTPIHLNFHDVHADDTYLPVLIALFLEIFPDYKRYVGQIKESVWLGAALNPNVLPHHWVVDWDGNFVGLMLLNYIPRGNFGFCRYIGVKNPYRDQGVGTEVIRQSMDQIRQDSVAYGNPDPIGFCLEALLPELTEDTREQRQRRLAAKFFLQNGAIELDVDYCEPVMIGDNNYIEEEEIGQLEPNPTRFMVIPADERVSRIPPDEARRLVRHVLVDHYCQAEESAFVKSVVKSITREGTREDSIVQLEE